MTLYIDFLCPYAWRGVELAELLGQQPDIRHYSLVQGNHPENPDRKNPTWWLTDRPQGEGTDAQRGSLAAFLAAQAAERQGAETGRRFTLHLLRLRHAERRDLNDPDTVLEAARRGGLDLARFEEDRQDEASLRSALRADLEAAAALGVFGTPTFVLDSGDAAYLRFATLPGTPDEARDLWELYTRVLTSGVRIETIKRPR